MVDKRELFLEHKEDVLNNLATLNGMLSHCIDLGYNDENEILYNAIETARENVYSADTSDELNEIIEQIKSIELRIDNYLVSKGLSTISLSWPNV